MMKKILLLSALSLMILMVGCSDGKDNIYGEYKLDEVSFLSPLSSSTKDSVKERMKDSTYIIQEDLFKVQSTELPVEVISPKYVKEEVDTESLAMFDTDFFRKNRIKAQYTIYDQDGIKIKSILYVSSDELWIATNINVAPNGQLVIFYIFKLSK